jgi:hypothetical protein
MNRSISTWDKSPPPSVCFVALSGSQVFFERAVFEPANVLGSTHRDIAKNGEVTPLSLTRIGQTTK